MKFKVGDKVRVINGGGADRFSDGRECIVAQTDNGSYYEYYISDGSCFDWMRGCKLELIKEKQMTKEDLKSGMLLLDNNDILRLFIFGKAYSVSNGSYDLSMIPEDLHSGGWGIKAVYEVTEEFGNGDFDYFLGDKNFIKYSTLLWEYKEPIKEMTVSEIAKELGYEIKVVAND